MTEYFGWRLERDKLAESLRTSLPPEFYLREAAHEVGLFYEGRPREVCVKIFDNTKVTCEQILAAAKKYQATI